MSIDKENYEYGKTSTFEAVADNEPVYRQRFGAGRSVDIVAQNLKTAFTGPIATALIAVAVVVVRSGVRLLRRAGKAATVGNRSAAPWRHAWRLK